MEQQPDLTESTSGRSVSIGARTVIGALCVLAFGALLWVDSLGPQRWLPSAAQALPGLQQLLEEGLILALVGAVLVGMALREYARMADALDAELPGAALVGGGILLLLLVRSSGFTHRSRQREGVAGLQSRRIPPPVLQKRAARDPSLEPPFRIRMEAGR